MNRVIKNHFSNIRYISAPGTLEAGDVMMAGKHFFIGLSERTNGEGAYQLINILENYGYTGSTLNVENVLHLKSGVSYLENNNLLSLVSLSIREEFKNFNIIPADDDESYASNSLWINDKVLVPCGFPKDKKEN